MIFKDCGEITDCISEINNSEIDNLKYIDVVMAMYNLIEYSNIYSKNIIEMNKIIIWQILNRSMLW